MTKKRISKNRKRIIAGSFVLVTLAGAITSSAFAASGQQIPAQILSGSDLRPISTNVTGTSALVREVAAPAENPNITIGSATGSLALSGLIKQVEQTDSNSPMPIYPEYYITDKTEPEDSTPSFVYIPEIPLSRELQEFTYERCLEKNLDYSVILALMWRESRFNSNAVGYNSNGTQDSGLMQINDCNKAWLDNELGITNLLDPKENIIAGTEMLGRLVQSHGSHNALLAYQYGEQGMLNRVSNGITSSTLTEMLYEKKTEYDNLILHYRQAEKVESL